MKTLTTFMLGIILLLMGLYMIIIGKEFESFYDYLRVISGVIILVKAYDKLDKSTD